MHSLRKPESGFSLIELAVVMLVISILLAGGLTAIGALRTNVGLKKTQSRIEIIVDALQLFLLRNDRLPCPADPTLPTTDVSYTMEVIDDLDDVDTPCDSGREIGTTGVYWGTVPYGTLQLPPGQNTDAWDNQFFYVVNGGAATNDSSTARDWNYGSAIQLWDRAESDPGPPAPVQLVANGVFAILSAGPNRAGGFRLNGNRQPAPIATSVDELDNQDADIHLVSADYSDSDTRPFDDVIKIYTEDQILAPLAKNGLAKTKQAHTIELMERIAESTIAFAARDNTDPDGDATFVGSVVPPVTPVFGTTHAAPCINAPIGSGPVDSGTPSVFHYPCDTNLRTVRRRIPRADADADLDGISDDGDGLSNASDNEGLVPFNNLSLTNTEVVDAWGNAIRYQAGISAAATGVWSGNSEDPAISVRSFGPDGASGGGDDIIMTYSAAELVGILARSGLQLD